MASEHEHAPTSSGSRLDAASQLKKLAATPRQAGEGARSSERIPINSAATDRYEYPSGPQEEDSDVVLSHALAGVKDIITKSNNRILEDTNRIWEAMQHVKAFQTQTELMESLERSRGIGIDVMQSLEQKQSHLTEFAEIGRNLSSYMKNLEGIMREVLLQLDSAGRIWRSKKDDLQQTASNLMSTLRETRPTVQLLIHSVQASSSLDIKLRDELEQMKDKVNIAQRSYPNDRHGSGLESPTLTKSATVNPKSPTANVGLFGSLAYHPSRQYQDVPDAYMKRYNHAKGSLAKGSAKWFISEPMFWDWLQSPQPIFLVCAGPQGVGKSAITSQVIDLLKGNEFQHAYFYLGNGKVQTAAGIALVLLEQLCKASGYYPPFLNPKIASTQPNDHRYAKVKSSILTTNRAKSPLSLLTKKHLPFGKSGKSYQTTRLTSSPDIFKVPFSGEPLLPTETPGIHQNIRGESVDSPRSSLPKPLSPSLSQASFNSALLGQNPPIRRGWTDIESESSELSIEPEPQFQASKREDPPQEAGEAGHEGLPTPSKQRGEQDEWKVPNIHALTKFLQETREHCNPRLFVVLDGWDEENMIEPREFRILLDFLLQPKFKCQVFLACRSCPLNLPDKTHLLQMSIGSGRRVTLQLEDVVLFIEGLLGETLKCEELGVEYRQVAREIAELSNGVFDLARIITEIFIFEILEMGQFRSKLLAFRSFSERAKYITESDSTISYGLSLMIPPRSDLDRAANALMGWLSLSTAPLSERALNEVFKNVLRHWKLSLGKGTGSSSNQSDILFSDSENLSVSSVLRRCEPYVVVDHGNDLVQFSRTTVEQAAVYVDSELKKGKLAMFLAKTCLDYFDAVEDFAEEGCMTELQLTTMLQKHAFLDHATQFAFYVALAHNIDDEEQDDLDEKVFHFLDSPSRVLAMQVFLYTNKTAPDQDEIFSSWEHFKSWVNSTSRLHAASRWGLLKTVKTLLKKDEEDILGKDFHGSIALHEAAKSGSTGVVKELLNVVTTDDQIMASAVNDKGKTPLFYALRGNHGGAVVLLFEAQCAGLTIKDVDNIKGTELDNAVPQYCLSKSELLDGADGAAYMDTALIKAVQDRLEVVATLLMHRGANPNAKDPKGKSVLYAAVQNGQDHLAALFLLKGANPSCGVPEDLEPILHLAVQNRLRLTVDCILESRSVDVNCQNLEGRTALFVAINTKDEEWAMDMTRLLLWNRLNVDLADKHDNHLMHIVAREGYVDVFAEIMSQSSLIAEPKNDKGKTPFKIAIEYGHYQIASFFRPIHDGQRQLG